ncbi:MAG: GNAT family N-acetyltransferase [Alphaproteobacteria bacterium]
MSEITIRSATVDDAEAIARLIAEHADYENAREQCHTTAADIRRDGFGARPVFEVLIAEQGGKPVGIAMYFEAFSSWEGRTILFLEDLYVSPQARRLGLGRRLMARIAAIALTRGCPRLDWLVTDGNPASDFYRRLDAGHMDDQLLYRLRGEKLRELADEAD